MSESVSKILSTEILDQTGPGVSKILSTEILDQTGVEVSKIIITMVLDRALTTGNFFFGH